MGIVATRSKMEATSAFINTWLKDNTTYCANCGTPAGMRVTQCCEAPHITDKWQRIADFISANKEERMHLAKSTGASKSGSMRMSIRLPYELLKDLQDYFKNVHGEEFLVDKAEGRAFMKAFPQFCACNEI